MEQGSHACTPCTTLTGKEADEQHPAQAACRGTQEACAVQEATGGDARPLPHGCLSSPTNSRLPSSRPMPVTAPTSVCVVDCRARSAGNGHGSHPPEQR